MRKRSRGTSGARARRYRRNKTARRGTPRRRLGQMEIVPKRRTYAGISLAAVASRSVAGKRKSSDKVPGRSQDRRASLRASRQNRAGLPVTLVPASRAHANASDKQTRRSLCTRKKAARRAVIIATGHGGINHVRKYRRRAKC